MLTVIVNKKVTDGRVIMSIVLLRIKICMSIVCYCDIFVLVAFLIDLNIFVSLFLEI